MKTNLKQLAEDNRGREGNVSLTARDMLALLAAAKPPASPAPDTVDDWIAAGKCQSTLMGVPPKNDVAISAKMFCLLVDNSSAPATPTPPPPKP